MTGATPRLKSAKPSRRQRLILAGLWLSVPLLIGIQYIGLQHLDYLNGQRELLDSGRLGPSPRWIFWGTMLPLAAVTMAFLLQFRWMSIGWRILAGIGLALLAPIDALASFAMLLLEDTSIEMANGRRFVVTPDDHAYTFLQEQVGPLGLYMRMVGAPLMGPGTRLTVSSDQKWLAVIADGNLTACYAILPQRLSECPAARTVLDGADFGAGVDARSAQITQLTGIRP